MKELNQACPAFPLTNLQTCSEDRGLTKREYFALHLMAARRANGANGNCDFLAELAVRDASALLAELEKPFK